MPATVTPGGSAGHHGIIEPHPGAAGRISELAADTQLAFGVVDVIDEALTRVQSMLRDADEPGEVLIGSRPAGSGDHPVTHHMGFVSSEGRRDIGQGHAGLEIGNRDAGSVRRWGQIEELLPGEGGGGHDDDQVPRHHDNVAINFDGAAGQDIERIIQAGFLD